MTQPWWTWSTEYPDEGRIVVDAEDEESALRAGSDAWNATGEPDEEPMEISAKPVTADEISELQDELEKFREAASEANAVLSGALGTST